MRVFALAADFVPIPAISYLLFIVSRCALSVVAAFATRDISGSTAAALIVASLSVSASPFRLGHEAGFSNAMRPYLSPHMLAEPFLLFALWRGIRGESVRAASACVPAILMHPAPGVSVARIVLIAALSRCLRLAWPYCPKTRARAHFAVGFLLVGFATGLFRIVPAIGSEAIFSSSLDNNEFVHILANIRHPHSLVPNTGPVWRWGATAFAVATVIALAEFRHAGAAETDQREHQARVTAIMAILVATTFCFFAGLALRGDYSDTVGSGSILLPAGRNLCLAGRAIGRRGNSEPICAERLAVGGLSLHRSGFLPEGEKISSFVAHLQPVLTLDEFREHFKGRAVRLGGSSKSENSIRCRVPCSSEMERMAAVSEKGCRSGLEGVSFSRGRNARMAPSL